MVLLSLFQAEFEARKSKEKLTNLDGENEVSFYLMVKYCKRRLQFMPFKPPAFAPLMYLHEFDTLIKVKVT